MEGGVPVSKQDRVTLPTLDSGSQIETLGSLRGGILKIADIETLVVGNPWKNQGFIKLRTDEGLYGIGEAAAHRKAKMMEAALLEYRRCNLDRNPFVLDAINY